MEALFFAGEGDEVEGVSWSRVCENAGKFGGHGDAAGVIVGTGGGAFGRLDAEVEAVEVTSDQDFVGAGSGEGGEDLGAGGVFGDAAPFGEGVVE